MTCSQAFYIDAAWKQGFLPLLVQEREDSLVFGLIDLNGHKEVNDIKGHPAGDNALKHIAEITSRNVRTNDIVARFGGDEFAVVLQSGEANAETAMRDVYSKH